MVGLKGSRVCVACKQITASTAFPGCYSLLLKLFHLLWMNFSVWNVCFH